MISGKGKALLSNCRFISPAGKMQSDRTVPELNIAISA